MTIKRAIGYLFSFVCLYLIYGIFSSTAVVPEAEIKKESIPVPVIPVVPVVQDKIVVPEEKKPAQVKEDTKEIPGGPKGIKDPGLDINLKPGDKKDSNPSYLDPLKSPKPQ